MNKLKAILIPTCMIIAVGCSTTSENSLSENTKQVSPRQGEEVQRVCNINGWSNAESNKNAIIVHNSRREAYKLSLIGMCDADWAMHKIGMTSKGGRNCLSRGDKIVTDADVSRGAVCTVMKIYHWLPEDQESKKTVEEK
ncbi:MAG: hypothetical protein ACI9YH_000019 [Colwellia sp.]|jgi:hypothetical protein